MAYRMPFTDRNGVTFPATVWLPLNVIPVFYPNQYALVTFLGFATPADARAALTAAMTGKGRMPEAVGLKDYRATADQLRAFAAGATGVTTRLADLWELAYLVQRATDDTLASTPADPLRMGNFFAAAEWVDVAPLGG